MPFYYVVAALVGVDGVTRPDVPEGISWAGDFHAASGTYLVKTRQVLPDAPGRVQVRTAEKLVEVCRARGLTYDEVARHWSIDGEV